MSNLPPDYSRDLNYSNPAVKISNVATGTFSQNNNAEKHRQTFGIVASFYNPPNFTLIDYNTCGQGDHCFPNKFKADITCPKNTYTYKWERKYGKFGTYTTLPYTTQTIQTPCDCYPSVGPQLVIRATVTDNVTGVQAQQIGVYDINTDPLPTPRTYTTAAKIIQEIYPNPANGNTQIVLKLVKSGKAKLEFINQNNVSIKTLQLGYINDGKHIVNFNTTTLANGVYTIKLLVNDTVETKQLIIYN